MKTELTELTRAWNMFYGSDGWMGIYSSKKECIDSIKQMVQNGSIKYYCGIQG
jgi:hypothetical protein